MADAGERVFLLSPAFCAGRRAKILLRPGSDVAIARRLQSGALTVGEAFAFLSGLYFRGKLAYARAFAAPPPGVPGLLVITPRRGLRPPDDPLTVRRLRSLAEVRIDVAELRYRRPLVRDLRRLAALIDEDCELVLLGSIATAKYAGPLARAFGEHLHFPAEFVGRGDMSRGALMLRHAAAGEELAYQRLDEQASLHGPRPPRLLR